MITRDKPNLEHATTIKNFLLFEPTLFATKFNQLDKLPSRQKDLKLALDQIVLSLANNSSHDKQMISHNIAINICFLAKTLSNHYHKNDDALAILKMAMKHALFKPHKSISLFDNPNRARELLNAEYYSLKPIDVFCVIS